MPAITGTRTVQFNHKTQCEGWQTGQPDRELPDL